ncbi:MAG: tRNA (adenosine(37)-N6)-dimethylallyltransferase MiaA [Saccharofermentanales bacterium]
MKSSMELPGPVIIITGPTASGKSACAMEFASTYDGEIICADSMQIYKDMDIGTAKPSVQEMENIPHHLFDLVTPETVFSVADYSEFVKPVIRDVLSRNKIPVLCGGTGQYILSVMNNISYPELPFDSELRRKLEEKADLNDVSGIPGIVGLYKDLQVRDPEAASRIHSNDRKRIIRALEVNILSGKSKSELERSSLLKGPEFKFLAFCLSRDRRELYSSINTRVDSMMSKGLLDEVISLRKKYPDLSRSAAQAIGYKELISYLNGETDLESAVEQIKQATRNYAKRQLTWFRKTAGLEWLEDLTLHESVSTIRKTLNTHIEQRETHRQQ